MSLDLDRRSLLAGVPATVTLAALERALRAEGLTLALDEALASSDTPIGEWLAAGAPGAPVAFADPADHLVAGLTAVLADGRRLEVRPGPRRSVGPDLVTLFVGARERFGTIERAWLRIHLAGVARPALPLPRADLDPPLSAEEAALVDAIGAALRESQT